MNCCKHGMAVVALLVIPLAACGPGITIPPAPPTFLEVVSTADGLRTSFAPDTPNARFAFFTHSDVFDEDACGDLAVAPDGIMRSLAVIRPDTARSRVLVIRTGLGPSNWSTTFTTASIPDTAAGFGNVPQCTPLRMIRMRDGLHAIFWTNPNTDSLFNAVYNSDNPQTLRFGTTIRRPNGMRTVPVRTFSPAFFRNEVHLTWSDSSKTRINTVRGTLSANGVTFTPASLIFTQVDHAEISDAVVANDTLFLAVRTANAIELRRKAASNVTFTVLASCPNPRPLRGRLLFRDAAGIWWVSESAMPENSTNVRLRSLADCSTRTVVAPIVFGQMYYHPGRP